MLPTCVDDSHKDVMINRCLLSARYTKFPPNTCNKKSKVAHKIQDFFGKIKSLFTLIFEHLLSTVLDRQ